MITVAALGTHLRQARDLAEYSQQEIAGILGVAREVVSYWENDRRTPSYAQLARLAEAYGVTTGSLLGAEPAPVAAEEHELIYRGLRSQPPRTKAAIRRWLAFLDDWADFLTSCNVELPGRATAPKKEWRAAQAITDSRLAPRLAADVRAYYDLGSDAIPDLLAFLDRERVLVYRVALDPIVERDGISGVYYNHPRLGSCILVNTATTPGRQTFTLAHEFAHALFHFQERGLVSRAGDPGRTERFADEFAAHFLVPNESLRKYVAQSPAGKIISPLDVIRLHRSFRVSYATMVNRLRSEGLLSSAMYEEYHDYSPSLLAARLGLAGVESQATDDRTGISLGSYPTSVLDRIRHLGEGRKPQSQCRRRSPSDFPRRSPWRTLGETGTGEGGGVARIRGTSFSVFAPQEREKRQEMNTPATLAITPSVADNMVLAMFVDADQAPLLAALAGGNMFVAPSILDPEETPPFAQQPTAEFARGAFYFQQRLGQPLDAVRLQRRIAFYLDAGVVWHPVALSPDELHLTDELLHSVTWQRAKGIDASLNIRRIGRGEAECAAVAITRGWTLWSDDAAILALIAALYPGHPTERISDLLIRAVTEGLLACEAAADLYNTVFTTRLGLWTTLRLVCQDDPLVVR